MSLLGYQWLIRHLALLDYPLPVRSQIGSQLKTAELRDGSVVKEFTPQYQPSDDPIGHLTFALKYEGVNLALLRECFRAIGPGPIEQHIRQTPTGKYSRLLGFFFEYTTGQRLDPDLMVGGNYVDALNPKDHIVSPHPQRNARWRVRDNLLGPPDYCPIIRHTPALAEGLAQPLQSELTALLADFPPVLFQRASDYLYTKETRSTFGIEHEPMPTADRALRFIALLHEAGEGSRATILGEATLVERQNRIVDPRYAVGHYRDYQNYVGEMRPDYTQRVHYACPPPHLVHPLMRGLAEVAERVEGLAPVLQASAVAFGFVFIHPFEDGNGRLHRFLIHDLLQRSGLGAPGLILPISATMLKHLTDYDASLERYSRPLMEQLLRYEVDDEGTLTLLNPEDVDAYYRYPDLTAQTEYLQQTLALTIQQVLKDELGFLLGYDQARNGIRALVDMPDRRLDLLLKLLHQNGGKLSGKKRDLFRELSDEEVERVERVFGEAFG